MSTDFRKKLTRDIGYSQAAVDAAWPEWWTPEAESSPSAIAELKFSLSRKLGLDPRALINNEATFFWDDSGKFKNFSGTEAEKMAICAFGMSVARILTQGTSTPIDNTLASASDLRKAVLANSPFVSLTDLVSICWALGIPVVHLKVHPLPAKRMCGMAVVTDGGPSIFLAKDNKYPCHTAFHLAHEIGHLSLGHVTNGEPVIDMEDPLRLGEEADDEELAADRFALELLTGNPNFEVEKIGRGRNPAELAKQCLDKGFEFRIEPGTLALCYGYATREWDVANSAIKGIYEKPYDVWKFINSTARSQIKWESISEDNRAFLEAVMGGTID